MCDIVRDTRWDYYRKLIELELSRSKAELEALESGEMKVAERLGEGPWVDVTQGTIASQRRSMAAFDALLLALQ